MLTIAEPERTLNSKIEADQKEPEDKASINEQKRQEENLENNLKQGKNSAIMELMNLLDFRLDYLFVQKALTDADVEAICSLHKVFFDYFLLEFEVKKEVYLRLHDGMKALAWLEND